MLLAPGSPKLNRHIMVENNIVDFVMFNPLEMIRVPFTIPWDTFYDRRFLWEYMFRSAFFGEWIFENLLLLGQTTIAVALLGIIPLFAGARRRWGQWDLTRPMLLLGAALLLTLATFRALHPCTCDQDFRYIPLIAVSAVALAFQGFTQWGATGTRLLMLWSLLLAALQSAFLVSFYWMS